MSAGTARASRGERAGLRGLFRSCVGICQTEGDHMAQPGRRYRIEVYRGDEAFAFVYDNVLPHELSQKRPLDKGSERLVR